MKMRMHRCRNFDERFAILQHCCLQPHTPHDSDREHNDSCAILQNIFVRIAKSARQLALARQSALQLQLWWWWVPAKALDSALAWVLAWARVQATVWARELAALRIQLSRPAFRLLPRKSRPNSRSKSVCRARHSSANSPFEHSDRLLDPMKDKVVDLQQLSIVFKKQMLRIIKIRNK